jgi:hypothetical protein
LREVDDHPVSNFATKSLACGNTAQPSRIMSSARAFPVDFMVIAAKKAAQLRILAAQCRGWAEESESPEYAAKMWRAAQELEEEARRMDATASGHPALSSLMAPNVKPFLRVA